MVKSLAQFVSTLRQAAIAAGILRNFSSGKSYGTFRSAALSNYLQSHDGLYFNGIVPNLFPC